MAAMKEMMLTLHDNLDALGFREWLRDQIRQGKYFAMKMRVAVEAEGMPIETRIQCPRTAALTEVAYRLGIDVSDLI